MKSVGIDIATAVRMTRKGYNDLRGWTLPDDERGEDAGWFLSRDDGYRNWMTEEDYAARYFTEASMPYYAALPLLLADSKIDRRGWNGSNMFIFMVPGSEFTVNRAPLLGIYPEGTKIKYLPHIDMKTAQGDVVPWLCSQSDAFATDWCVVEEA